MAERLELTADQQKKIAVLEKETKAKLKKILTPKQKKILEQAGPPRSVKVDQVARAGRVDKAADGAGKVVRVVVRTVDLVVRTADLAARRWTRWSWRR